MTPAGHPGEPPEGSERRFGFRPAGEEPQVPLPHQVQAHLEDHRAAQPPAPPFELSWFLALVTGFGGTLVGALVGVPGAPPLAAALAFLPLWLRIVRGGKVGAAALAAVAWMIGCVGGGAGLGAEALDGRLAQAVPLAAAYERLLPVYGGGAAGWMRSVLPAAVVFWVVSGLGRFGQGLASVLAASVPATWMAARAGRFTAAALERDWEPSSAFLASAAPHHLLVLGGALAVAAVLGSPRGERGIPPEGTVERRVYLVGLAAGLLGLLAGPWLDSLWRLNASL